MYALVQVDLPTDNPQEAQDLLRGMFDTIGEVDGTVYWSDPDFKVTITKSDGGKESFGIDGEILKEG